MSGNDGKKIKLVEMRQTWFRTESGAVVNLEEASPEQFDTFITKYIDIEDVDRTAWDLMLRWRAVNFAVKNGQFLEFCEVPESEQSA